MASELHLPNTHRFDDTNPDAEEKVYFDAIEEIVRWLGASSPPPPPTHTISL